MVPAIQTSMCTSMIIRMDISSAVSSVLRSAFAARAQDDSFFLLDSGEVEAWDVSSKAMQYSVAVSQHLVYA